MLAVRPNPPLSPVSTSGTIWPTGMESDGPDQNAPLGLKLNPMQAQGQLASPPYSGGGNGPMNGGFPPQQGPRSAGGPSPPPSVGRSSTQTDLYARSESGQRPNRDADNEGVLGQHYVALKRYLSQTSRDGKPTLPANKARDKLQRLTSVQFLELSTDVFDELLRRQAFSRRPPNAPPSVGPPAYLLAEDNFHPKRNQARQKLSSLGPPRFRDLATDVFCELERRFPRFVAGDIPRMTSPQSSRAPSRPGTAMSSMSGMGGYPPRGMSRRQPSNASSIRGALQDAYDIPPSPGIAPLNYDRPQPKQSQSNTIIPNKSTMVEEDDDSNDEAQPSYGMNNNGANNGGGSEEDKRAIADYEIQVKELREKLDTMEDDLKKKDDELNQVLDGERSRSTAENAENQLRLDLESKLTEAQNLNTALREELDRLRDEHADEIRQLREELEDANAAVRNASSGRGDEELERENQDLRNQVKEQRDITAQVRREAQDFLREMKLLSEQSGSSFAKQGELEQTIESLEQEVRDWRNRYAKAKTQLRGMRSGSMSISGDQDAARYVRDKGFTDDSGLVKDVHVTKFQVAIDELLRRARQDQADTVIDAMKSVVMSVRRITKDFEASPAKDEQAKQQRKQLKSRVSSTANGLITATKTFASSAGIAPVSILDAASSHLVAAMVDLLRVVKIRVTPDGELEEEDDGTVTPVESAGFFSPRTAKSQSIQSSYQQEAYQPDLPPPPPFQGLGRRTSVDSSAYSPINSPRESADTYNKANGNGNGYPAPLAPLASASNGYGMRQADSKAEDLKVYLDDQTANLVQTIQGLVSSIRGAANIDQIDPQIRSIVDTVNRVITEADNAGHGEMVGRLADSQQRLMEAGERGHDLADDGKGDGDREWRMWTQTLPPIAFEIARETKELVQRIAQLTEANNEFS